MEPEQFVWVTVGRELWPAHVVQWQHSPGQALVRWDNGKIETVLHGDISLELPSRRQKRTHTGHIKTEPEPVSSSSLLLTEMSSSSGTTSATVWSSSNAASKHGDDPASGTTTKEEPIPDEPASGTTTNEEPIPDEPASETTTKEEPIPDEPASRTTTNEEPIPDVPAISNANVPSALLQSMQQDFQDAKIKKEGDKVVLNSKERAFRQTELRALIKANRDPQGNPRFVFRRGCSVSITTVLGGQGVHPWPIVKNVPDMGKDFISAGEFYFAGVEHFNHFVPKYPGAKGFIDSTALRDNRKSQPTFHVFVQCSQQRYHKYWYGTNAKGGYLC